MQTKLNPYLGFQDNARQAMEFYQTVFGGKLMMSTFKEFNASQDSSQDNKIMHAMLEADNGMTFMASDTPDCMECDISPCLKGRGFQSSRTGFPASLGVARSS